MSTLITNDGTELYFKDWGAGQLVVLGAYFTLAGLVRFAIEFIRVNDRVVGVLTVAHREIPLAFSMVAIYVAAMLLL